MVDPTAWANVRLPSVVHEGVRSTQEAYSIGQEQGLRGVALRTSRKKEQTDQTVDALRKKAFEAWKADDRALMMNTFSEMAIHNPDAAQKSKDTFADFDRTNGVTSAMHLYNALALDGEARNTSLDKAIETSGIGPNNPIYGRLVDIRNTTDVDKQNEMLIQGIKDATRMGLLPEPSLEQQKLDISKRRLALSASEAVLAHYNRVEDNARLEKSLKETKAQNKFNRMNLSTQETKLLAGWNEEYEGARGQYDRYRGLADRFSELQATGYVAGKVGAGKELLRRISGMQNDEVDALYRDFRRIRGLIAIESLPPGVASDFDISLALRGTPPDNANAEYISSWLHGLAKLKAATAARARAKSDHLEEARTVSGYNDFWKANSKQYLAEAFGVPEEALSYKPAGGEKWTLEMYKPEPLPEDPSPPDNTLLTPGEKAMPGIGDAMPVIDKEDTSYNLHREELELVKKAAIAMHLPWDRILKNDRTGEYGFKDQTGKFIPLNLPTM